jgi:ABC-2 type transport system permease protein
MIAQLRSEWIKLRSTRLLYGLVGIHLAVTLLQVALIFVNAGRINTPSLGTTESVLRFVATSSYGSYVALILGILLIGNEHRHHTISATYITQPARGVVLAAKALLGGTTGASVSAIGLAATAALAVPLLVAKGVPIDVAHSRYLLAVAGTLLAAAVYGLLGVGLGALVKNTTAAIGAAVGYALVVENVLVALAFPGLGPWLPGGAVNALVGTTPSAAGYSSPATAAVVLAVYGVFFLALGFVATTRRDVI